MVVVLRGCVDNLTWDFGNTAGETPCGDVNKSQNEIKLPILRIISLFIQEIMVSLVVNSSTSYQLHQVYRY
ncbi:hypothetical protein Pmani_018646 [Petrolisthes manimaculis]|uniref:Uncharacterized protein n=1 Tax=Petrolisthes manimaculis TaxID=1843537 RepID=A0AAE1PL40_9EUCA|nr:hypothetical protein Pmani_018646 [Petrolisthes manimaculis]